MIATNVPEETVYDEGEVSWTDMLNLECDQIEMFRQNLKTHDGVKSNKTTT